MASNFFQFFLNEKYSSTRCKHQHAHHQPHHHHRPAHRWFCRKFRAACAAVAAVRSAGGRVSAGRAFRASGRVENTPNEAWWSVGDESNTYKHVQTHTNTYKHVQTFPNTYKHTHIIHNHTHHTQPHSTKHIIHTITLNQTPALSIAHLMSHRIALGQTPTQLAQAVVVHIDANARLQQQTAQLIVLQECAWSTAHPPVSIFFFFFFVVLLVGWASGCEQFKTVFLVRF